MPYARPLEEMRDDHRQMVWDSLVATEKLIRSGNHFDPFIPFELRKLNESLLLAYLGGVGIFKDAQSEIRRVRRLYELLLIWADRVGDGFFTNLSNWKLRLHQSVMRFFLKQKLYFKNKTVPPARLRRRGGSSFFSATRPNLRNAP